jgi:predicted O-linked N-acetylglucosamine transferase (SPINDLY family)
MGISIGPDDGSATRARLQAGFDQFIDARDKSDLEVARGLRDYEIDIAVDLQGHTKDARPNILSYRPAPIQVNYLGYPGTMGADYIDYILADEFVIPVEHQVYYTEKVVYLPDTYQPNDSKRSIPVHTPTRTEAGLPQHAFVFCCFNSNHKITPRVFDAWIRILKQVEGSVLWLLEGNETTISNLRTEAADWGVSPERLIFAKRLPLPEHLARHRLADLFLDTLPYNAHTTASDALWVGVPVVTCVGGTFPGRVAASLLDAIGLPELTTTTPEAYEALAIDLAMRPEKLAAVRGKLAANRLTTPLFDTKLTTRHLEAAYSAMVERHRAGLPPDHIVIPA